MKKCKKLILSLIFVLTVICCYQNVSANTINKIEMNVYIDSDGTANIEEIWDANLTSGTEGYRPYDNLGNMVVKDFTVEDDTGVVYTYQKSWNVSGSFESKKYKNGINKAGTGIELCWGISKYGNRTYTLKYKITNFVNKYMDETQGVYFNFIPVSMDQSLSQVIVNISSDQGFNETNSKIWAFGYNGDIHFVDSKIVMKSNGTLPSSSYMTALVKLEKDMFDTKNNVNKTFDAVYEEAMVGVKQEENPNHGNTIISGGIKTNEINTNIFIFMGIFLSIFSFVIPIVVIAIIAKHYSNNPIVGFDNVSFKNIGNLPKIKEVGYYRDIPEINLTRAFWILYSFNILKDKSRLIGAIFLKWINEGKVTITKNKKGLFSFKDNNYAIDFTNFEHSVDELENKLLSYLRTASGDNLILEPKEFEKWCRLNYSKLDGWFDIVLKTETNRLIKEGYIEEKVEPVTYLFGLIKTTKTKREALPKLKEEALNLLGLKRFLLDYSLINTREAIEVKLWEEYLIFAQLLDIADKVKEQFEKLYPDFNNISNINTDYMMVTKAFAYSGYIAASRAQTAANASSYSSGGGGSSFSGGGGSAGGSSSGGGFR